MKSTASQQVRDAQAAANIVTEVRRTLASVHGFGAVYWATERQLLAYAKRARMLDEGEILVCQAVYGSF